MKVRVTKDCMGDRRCNDLCPEVFQYDYEMLVRQAADECGAGAIIVQED